MNHLILIDAQNLSLTNETGVQSKSKKEMKNEPMQHECACVE